MQTVLATSEELMRAVNSQPAVEKLVLAIDAEDGQLLSRLHEIVVQVARNQAEKRGQTDQVKSWKIGDVTGWSFAKNEAHFIVGNRWDSVLSGGGQRHVGLVNGKGHWYETVQRVAPWLMGLFSVVTLIWNEYLRGHTPRTAHRSWYTKAQPTFADALRAVRELIWVESIFVHPLVAPGLQKLPAKTRKILLHWLAQAL